MAPKTQRVKKGRPPALYLRVTTMQCITGRLFARLPVLPIWGLLSLEVRALRFDDRWEVDRY